MCIEREPCTARCSWGAGTSPRTSKGGLEIAHTMEGHWEQRLGRGLVKTELERPSRLFPPLEPGAPPCLCSHWGRHWLRQEQKREVLPLRVTDTQPPAHR